MERKRDLYMIFIDLENVYDKVGEVLWRCLKAGGVSMTYIGVMKDIMIEPSPG